MIESDDNYLKVARFDDMREGMIQRGNAELPFEIIYDRTILKYMLQYASHIKYVIFKSDFITSIIKTAAIPQILNELDYSKIS